MCPSGASTARAARAPTLSTFRPVDRYLESNAITGYLPTELGRLTALTNLLLNDNELSGTIPAELSGMAALEVFTLFNNTGMCGSLPAGTPTAALQVWP